MTLAERINSGEFYNKIPYPVRQRLTLTNEQLRLITQRSIDCGIWLGSRGTRLV